METRRGSASGKRRREGESDDGVPDLSRDTEWEIAMKEQQAYAKRLDDKKEQAQQRAAKVTDGTPAAFTMNYEAAENGPGHPVPRAGERSLIGPVYFHHSYGGWAEDAPDWAKKAAAEDPQTPSTSSHNTNLKELRVVIAALRQPLQLKVELFTPEQLREDGWDADETLQTAEKKALYAGDLELLEEPLVFGALLHKTPLVELRGFHGEHGRSWLDQYGMTARVNPWVHIKLLPACTRQLEEELVALLHKAGAMVAVIPHAQKAVNLSRLGPTKDIGGAIYEMRVTHGEGELAANDGERPRNVHDLGSLFELKRSSNGRVVGKVLVSYHNSEMGTGGPTIEIVEVADGWRGFGLGESMMRAVNDFYTNLYHRQLYGQTLGYDPKQPTKPGLCEHAGLTMSVCNCISQETSLWFQRRCHFECADGMGNELIKSLIEAERDDQLEYHDIGSDDPDYEDPDLLEDSLPYPIYSCRGTLAHKLTCCVEIEWHGKGRMPKERRFCSRCMKGKWDPRLQFEREAVLD